MKTKISILVIIQLIFSGLIRLYSQDTISIAKPIDKLTIGLGVGLDHGGIGANMVYYPHKNIGIFAGAGYAIAGPGYNAGLKIRMISDKPSSKISPYLLAMYGYNAAIAVMDKTSLNKLFYGVSFGIGIDTRIKNDKRHYWTFAILVPIRSEDVDQYVDDLKNNEGVEFKNELLPIGFSIGYKYCLYK